MGLNRGVVFKALAIFNSLVAVSIRHKLSEPNFSVGIRASHIIPAIEL